MRALADRVRGAADVGRDDRPGRRHRLEHEFGNASLVEQSTDTSNKPCRLGGCARSPAKWTIDCDPQRRRPRPRSRPAPGRHPQSRSGVQGSTAQRGDGDRAEERGVILHRRQPRDDADDECALRYAELVEHARAIAGGIGSNACGSRKFGMVTIRDDGTPPSVSTSRATLGLLPMTAVREPVGDPIRPQDLSPKMWRVPRTAARDHPSAHRLAAPRASRRRSYRHRGCARSRSRLAPQQPDSRIRLPVSPSSPRGSSCGKGAPGYPARRSAPSTVRSPECRPLTTANRRRSSRSAVRTAFSSVPPNCMLSIQYTTRIGSSGRSDGQACLVDAGLFEMDRLDGRDSTGRPSGRQWRRCNSGARRNSGAALSWSRPHVPR